MAPDRRQGDPVAHGEVVWRRRRSRAAPRPGVDEDPADPVGPLDGRDLEDPADHDVAQPLADVLDRLDDEPEVVERGAQRPDVVGERERSHGAS